MNKKQLQELLPDSRDRINVSGIKETEIGKSMMTAVENKMRDVRRMAESNGRISDVFKDDIRYKLGFTAALNWLLNLPEEIKNLSNKMED